MHLGDALSLLVAALGAFGVPLLAGRIGIPAAVGEMLFGALVGPAVLGWIRPEGFFEFLGELGFAFLMFLAGLEIDFGKIERQGPKVVVGATGVAAGVFALAFAATFLLGLPLFLFVAVGAVGVSVVLVTLNESGLGRGHLGQTIILIASVGEFITIVLLTVTTVYARAGFGWPLVLTFVKLTAVLFAAYLVLVVLRNLLWWYPASFARLVAANDPSEIGVRAGMVMMLVFVALTSMLGVKPILGAFVAGALSSFVFREKGILETKLSSIGFGFFVPIFFIFVGVDFDVKAAARVDVLPLLGLLLVGSLLAKVLATLPLTGRGFSLRDALAAGLLLNTPLTLLVVIARIGTDTGLIDELTAGATILLAAVTALVLPSVFRVLAASSGVKTTD